MALGKIIGGVAGIPFGPFGVGAGILIGGSDEAKKVAAVTTKFIAGVGEVTVSAGTTILDAVGDAAKAFIELVGDLAGAIALRPLRPSEREVAKQVYINSPACIPFDRIVVCSLNGWGQRPFVLPGGMVSTLGFAIPGIGPLLAVSSILGNLTDKYILFLGRDGYRNALWKRNSDDIPGQTLIHELAHAWEGLHTRFAWSYVFESMMEQAKKGQEAYAYTPGAQFRTYNPEQKAHLVEDWFVECNKGKNGGPNLRHYMTCNIWPGTPDAETVFPPASPGSLMLAAKNMEAQGQALIVMSGYGTIPQRYHLYVQGQQLLAQAKVLHGEGRGRAAPWIGQIQNGAVGNSFQF